MGSVPFGINIVNSAGSALTSLHAGIAGSTRNATGYYAAELLCGVRQQKHVPHADALPPPAARHVFFK